MGDARSRYEAMARGEQVARRAASEMERDKMVVVVIEVPRVIAKRETLTRLRAAVSAVFGRQEIGVWANGQPVELDPFGMAMLTVLVAEAELLRAEQGALDLGQHGSPEVERG